MKATPYIIATLFVTATILFGACTTDKLDPPTAVENCEPGIYSYDENIASLITKYCSGTACHIGGSAPGTYNDYAGMLSNLESGLIKKEVIELREMPPSYSNGPKEIEEADFAAIECWLENDYPEN